MSSGGRSNDLPAGQREAARLLRFGLIPFAARFPTVVDRIKLRVDGDVDRPLDVGGQLAQRLKRIEQTSDFHCVTTWSRRALRWSGFRFADFYREIVLPLAGAAEDARFVVLRGQDGARTSLPLDDLLAADVLLADRLSDQPLCLAHGAPLHLVAPSHYGYKSVKYVCRVEFRRSDAGYRPTGLRWMHHPRARVDREERGQWLPGWLLRYLYRPLIRPTAAHFERTLRQHRDITASEKETSL